MLTHSDRSCQICLKAAMKFEIYLPKLPLTNVYFANPKDEYIKAYDLRVSECECGHIQAYSKCNATQIYNADYGYDGKSPTVLARRSEAIQLIKAHVENLEFATVVDIGCGQQELLLLAQQNFTAKRYIGIDPVPLRTKSTTLIEHYQDYFYGSNFILEKEGGANLFLLDNVLEHIPQLNAFLSNLNKISTYGDYVYICVPSC